MLSLHIRPILLFLIITHSQITWTIVGAFFEKYIVSVGNQTWLSQCEIQVWTWKHVIAWNTDSNIL